MSNFSPFFSGASDTLEQISVFSYRFIVVSRYPNRRGSTVEGPRWCTTGDLPVQTRVHGGVPSWQSRSDEGPPGTSLVVTGRDPDLPRFFRPIPRYHGIEKSRFRDNSAVI